MLDLTHPCEGCHIEEATPGSAFCSYRCADFHLSPRWGVRGINRKRLHEVFDLVKNKEHWKLPIACSVPKTAATCTEIEAAIDYFIGGGAVVWSSVYSVNWSINAPGYYAKVGA